MGFCGSLDEDMLGYPPGELGVRGVVVKDWTLGGHSNAVQDVLSAIAKE